MASVTSAGHAQPVSRELSIYLDAVRFCAAMVVFIGHVSGQRFTGGLGWQFGQYMDEAVTVFFVLSGFVIAFVVDRPGATAQEYAVARAARIYSVVLPAIIATVVLDAAGRAIAPEAYDPWWGFRPLDSLWSILATVFFLNRLWYLDLSVGSMLPFWSLCHEVIYYLAFGLWMFLRGPSRWLAAGLVLVMAGPDIAAFFPLWLIGVACYRLGRGRRIGAGPGLALAIGGPLLFLGHDALMASGGSPLAVLVPSFITLTDPHHAYVTAIAFALHLVGMQAIAGWFGTPLRAVERPVRWLAGATFTIYLFHLPLCQFLAVLVPWPPESWATRIVVFGGGFAAMLAIAQVTEQQKGAWQAFFRSVLRRASRLRPTAAG